MCYISLVSDPKCGVCVRLLRMFHCLGDLHKTHLIRCLVILHLTLSSKVRYSHSIRLFIRQPVVSYKVPLYSCDSSKMYYVVRVIYAVQPVA